MDSVFKDLSRSLSAIRFPRSIRRCLLELLVRIEDAYRCGCGFGEASC